MPSISTRNSLSSTSTLVEREVRTRFWPAVDVHLCVALSDQKVLATGTAAVAVHCDTHTDGPELRIRASRAAAVRDALLRNALGVRR
jgi:hypothetical protein